MTKRRSKIAATQRDKYAIEVAKYLKKAGIISKQANLHSGKYISKKVLKKTRDYEQAYRMELKAHKASKSLVKKAREKGFLTIAGTKIIGPKTKTFTKRLAEGLVTGVRPIKGGILEQVILASGPLNIHQTINKISQGIDDLKAPNERFGFQIGNNIGGSASGYYRGFKDTKEMLEFMQHYKFWDASADNEGEVEALIVFKAHRDEIEILQRNAQMSEIAEIHRAYQLNKRARARMSPSGRNETISKQAKSTAEKLMRVHPSVRGEYHQRLLDKWKAQREKRKATNPDEYARKNRERMQRRRKK